MVGNTWLTSSPTISPAGPLSDIPINIETVGTIIAAIILLPDNNLNFLFLVANAEKIKFKPVKQAEKGKKISHFIRSLFPKNLLIPLLKMITKKNAIIVKIIER